MNSRNELEKTLIRENDELTNTEERIRAIRKCGEINPFDFHDVPQDNEIDLNKFLDIAESNIVLYENEPIVNIIIDADKDSYPFNLTGEMIKYTLVSNEVKRSNHGKGCDVFKNILESRGEFCFIPSANECFRKCIEFIYQKGFSHEYRELIQDSDRCKNMMTSARIQPFCKKKTISI